MSPRGKRLEGPSFPPPAPITPPPHYTHFPAELTKKTPPWPLLSLPPFSAAKKIFRKMRCKIPLQLQRHLSWLPGLHSWNIPLESSGHNELARHMTKNGDCSRNSLRAGRGWWGGQGWGGIGSPSQPVSSRNFTLSKSDACKASTPDHRIPWTFFFPITAH